MAAFRASRCVAFNSWIKLLDDWEQFLADLDFFGRRAVFHFPGFVLRDGAVHNVRRRSGEEFAERSCQLGFLVGAVLFKRFDLASATFLGASMMFSISF